MVPVAAILQLSILEEVSVLSKGSSVPIHCLANVIMMEVGDAAILDVAADVNN